MKSFFMFLMLLSASICCAQVFQFDRIKVNDAKTIEQKFNAREETLKYKVSLSKEYFPAADSFQLAQPYIFTRPDSTWDPDPRIDYFFTEVDSIVRFIDYSWNAWDLKKMGKLADILSLTKETPSRKKYDDKYFMLRSDIVKQLGEPTEANDSLHFVEKDNSKWQERSAKWKTGRCLTSLVLMWAPPDKHFGTYRIRVTTYW